MGALGIVHPPGMDGPFQKCARLYFSEEFLSAPPMWMTVALPPEEDAHAWLATMAEFDNKVHHQMLHKGYDAIRLDVPDYTGWFLWPRGTLLTYDFIYDCGPPERPHPKKVIWRLTGLYFPLTTTTVYEGAWPD